VRTTSSGDGPVEVEAETSTSSGKIHRDEKQVILETLVEQGLTSHETHYRSYRDGFLWVKWPNQQCQSTEGR